MSQQYPLPKHTQSLWIDNHQIPTFPSLDTNIQVDIAIVGGGITGITSAYILAKEGFKVAILEADRLLSGTTGHTTAKVTAQHGLIYDELIKTIGEEKAKLYYEANINALHFIEKTIQDQQIDCNLSKEDAFIYATTDTSAEKIKKEAKAYEKLGIDGKLVKEIPLNFSIINALVMNDQAQFNPIKYLSYLIESIVDKGGLFFEDTTAINIQKNEQPTIITNKDYHVSANQILICSHFPFYEGLGLYSTRLHASRSYIIAAKIKKEFPGDMYISADKPTRSLRSVRINDENMILISGEDHKTGQGIDTREHFNALTAFGHQHFEIEDVAYHWSAQDLITLDHLPYIGQITAGDPNILVATGYRKWGMTNGTVAALLLRDMILNKQNQYSEVFTPTRLHIQPSLKNFFSQNANVVSELVKGKLEIPASNVDDLTNDEGIIIQVDGERKGAYKDESGEIYIVDTTCTHVGCEVGWNSGERSWDCPCHGSRFSYTGDVIEGPAETPLKRYDYKLIDNFTSDDSGY